MGTLTRNVVLFGIASLLADVSGEMVMAIMPFLLMAQGAGAIALGAFGGITDALGHIVKVVGGAWGDRARRRKPLILVGYLTAAVARLGMGFATVWPATLAFRGADRVGKGLRSAPRDALLAESVPISARGRAFGFHRAADTTGAILGVGGVLVALSFAFSASRIVLLAGAIGLLTLIPLAFVTERLRTAEERPTLRKAFEKPSRQYLSFLAVAALFAVGNVNYLFYLLRAAAVVGGERAAIVLYLAFNIVYAAGAYPAGMLADRWGRPRVLAFGFLMMASSAALLAFHPTRETAWLAFLALGFGFAGVDGTQRAFAADLAGPHARSTRLGLFHATVGLATVVGGLVAGVLWGLDPTYPFLWGAAVPLAALIALAAMGFLKPASN